MDKYEVQGGQIIDGLAKKYAKENGVSYSAAVHAVVKQFTDKRERAEQEYCKEKNIRRFQDAPPSTVLKDSQGDVVELAGNGRAIGELSSIVGGLPKQPDRSINVPLALNVINTSFRDLAGRAAGDWITTEARKRMRDENATAGDLAAEGSSTYLTMLSRLSREVMAQFPDVTAVYNGAQMTEGVLKQILWPMFRTSQQYQNKTEIRRYEFRVK